MALDPPSVVGAEIATAVTSIGVEPGTPVTPAQLIAMWTAVYTVIYTQLTTKAQVAPGSFANGGGPVGGLGGPLS